MSFDNEENASVIERQRRNDVLTNENIRSMGLNQGEYGGVYNISQPRSATYALTFLPW
jgi:hypothetical protein